LVAEELEVTIWKDNEKILSLYKDYEEISPNFKQSITVKKPKVIYPKNLGMPDKITIYKDEETVTFYYGDKTNVWDLRRKDRLFPLSNESEDHQK